MNGEIICYPINKTNSLWESKTVLAAPTEHGDKIRAIKKYVPGIKERVKWGRQSLGYKYEYKYEDLSKL